MDSLTVQTAVVIHCPDNVMSGRLITKDVRQAHFGQVAGGSGSSSPEKYQRQMIVEGTGAPCPKTNTRINLRTNQLVELSHPNTQKDGFDYSEDFDGLQRFGEKKVFVNLKCIVGKGGSQTRSLREVYHMMEGQLRICQTTEHVYFANVLDGDESNYSMPKFEYLLNEYTDVKPRVYAGDLKGYFDWLCQSVVPESDTTKHGRLTQTEFVYGHILSTLEIEGETNSNTPPV